MKLLKELNNTHVGVEYLDEGTNGEKNLYLTGVFMQAVPNRNKRLYSEEVLSKEVSRYMKESVKQGRAYGELGHPPGPQINLDRVCHLVEDLRMDGKNVIGRAKVLTETPMGATVRGLIKGGANLGVSSRGLGSLKLDEKTGLNIVQEDFRLVTAADVVADPSAPDAFVTGIMEETEWVFNAATGTWMESRVEPLKESMKKLSTRELAEKKVAIFESFLKNLSKKKS